MSHQDQLARYYTDDGLTVLCRACAPARQAAREWCQHAETPATWEELECEDCGARNEQAALWYGGEA